MFYSFNYICIGNTKCRRECDTITLIVYVRKFINFVPSQYQTHFMKLCEPFDVLRYQIM